MSHLQVLLVASITWIAWVPAAVLQKRARGVPGSTSIAHVPLLPLVAWGLAWLLQHAGMPAGSMAIGWAHLLLLAAMLISMARSWLAIRSKAS